MRLTWIGLGKPFCFALPPDKSATGRHHMPSLFVGCADARVTVNGRVLPGKPIPREIAATADHLKAIHDFSEELKEGIGATSLYNESLGTVSEAYVYDRVKDRDKSESERPKRPWQGKGKPKNA